MRRSRDVRSSAAVCCGLIAVTIVAIRRPIVAADVVDPRAVVAIENFLARPAIPHQYSASRRLEASGGGQHAWLEVRTDFTPATNFVYEVTAEGGSGYIRSRVLRSLLEEEKALIGRSATATVAISTDNYTFAPEGVNADGLAVVGITPRRKERSLIRGRVFLTTDGELVRVEGVLAKNPSFWTTRVNVVRSYQRINGVLMPASLDTTARLRLLGSSSLRMTYRYSHIDDQPVDAQTQ